MTWRACLAAALLPGAIGLGALAPGEAAAPVTGPGCVPTRPAVAHGSGGRVLRPQPANPPIPCGMRTGFPGAETRIAVTRSGALVFAPAVLPDGPGGFGYAPGAPGAAQSSANPAALAVSHDRGGRWSKVLPLGMPWGSTDHQMYVDRDTGRFFFYALYSGAPPQTHPGALPPAEQVPGGEAHLLVSPDDGRTWTHSTTCCPAFSENPRFVAAPAPVGVRKPAGYLNVVYFCANSTIGFTSPIINNRVCSRSFDGGKSWDEAAQMFNSFQPVHPECGSAMEEFGATDGNYPQRASDGSLYVMVNCGGKNFLARSTDAASSWPVVRRATGQPLELPPGDELRIDPSNNFYLARLSGAKLLLRVSRDRGRSWSPEQDVTAPGVAAIGTWFFAVRQPGHAVFSYYGSRAETTTSDGYLTETRTALRQPVFWSATVNDPRTPLLLGEQGSRPAGPGFLDYNGADIGPDGSAWGSFVQDCGTSPSDARCDVGGRHLAAYGFVGRLLWRR